jgi:fructokinase
MTTKAVLGFGEVLLDIILKDKKVHKVQPGGSVLNALVSLSRSSINVDLISEIGDDPAGTIITDFLIQEKIQETYPLRSKNCQTALAFAMLNENGDAIYSFYKNYPDLRFDNLSVDIQPYRVFLFGSTLALDPQIHEVLSKLVYEACQNQTLVMYDPNIRNTFNSNDASSVQRLTFNLANADIIRGSKEDFEPVFGTSNIQSIFQMIQPSRCKLLIVTAASEEIQLMNHLFQTKLKVKNVTIVNTIGAGDAFNAGVITYILRNSLTIDDLSNLNSNQLNLLGDFAQNFSLLVCASDESYIPKRD